MKKIILILFTFLSVNFAFSQCTNKPTINSFAPNTGFIGSTVTISGAHFDATTITNNKVFFGATQATVQSANFGQLVVTVPVGASTARISVTNHCNLTAYSKAPFNGIFCPTPLNNSTYQNSAQNLPITYGAYNMIAVDLDLDGKPEVLSGGQSGGVSVAKNNSTPGNISFSALNFSQFGAPSIYTADFDGDGLQDIVSRNIALLNTSSGPGNISFGPAISTNNVSGYQVAAGDFNNDGKIDIIGENGNVIYVAQNNSSGPGNLSFGAIQSIQNVGTRCTGIMVADVDGDGKQDILATQGNLDRAITLRNITPDGSPTFQFEAMETWASNGDYPYRCQIADFNKDGFVFYTNLNSQKGNELKKNPKASMCFHWKSLLRQVRINGMVQKVSNKVADEYYNSRGYESRIGAWASKQSTVLNNRDELLNSIEEYKKKYSNKNDVPRPEHWSGWNLIPTSIEFWLDGDSRIHERLKYTKDTEGNWVKSLLSP